MFDLLHDTLVLHTVNGNLEIARRVDFLLSTQYTTASIDSLWYVGRSDGGDKVGEVF